MVLEETELMDLVHNLPRRDAVKVLINALESLANQVYARHVYLPRDVQQNATFVDIVTVSPDGGRIIDLANFEKWVPNVSDKLAGEFL